MIDIDTLPPCDGCGRPMAPARMAAEDRPEGAVRVCARGLCDTCYARDRVELVGRPEPSPEKRAGIRFPAEIPLLPRGYEPEDLPCVQDPGTWFPEDGNGASFATARKFCLQHCPATDDCLELALKVEGTKHRSARFGMYGGRTPEERARIATARAAEAATKAAHAAVAS